MVIGAWALVISFFLLRGLPKVNVNYIDPRQSCAASRRVPIKNLIRESNFMAHSHDSQQTDDGPFEIALVGDLTDNEATIHDSVVGTDPPALFASSTAPR